MYKVDSYNKRISDELGTEMRSYIATDSIKEADVAEEMGTGNGTRYELDPSSILDYYATETPPGLPAHSLELRKGAICRIMRNFSIDKGLVKNTRVVITKLLRHVIVVRRLNTSSLSVDIEELLIPRISFSYDLEPGYTLCRRQFPLSLAYASTFNSCQGLTLDSVGIDLTVPVFSHGQLYTALSRIKGREDACVLFPDSTNDTTNVTYKELLL